MDAVASMLYLDYGRKDGEWIPNEYGGKENLEAIEFLRQFNREVYGQFPDVQTIAEESTVWPMVSRPAHIGGLGFGYKWDMGWMNDTLRYFKDDPVHRKYHHNLLTFRSMYQYAENYVLPLSHDEVVHLKGSLLSRMPGDAWQKFANLRLLLVNQWTQPGKKLLFMGGEFGQWARVEPRRQPRLEPAGVGVAQGRAEAGGRPQPPVPQRARPARGRLRDLRLRVDRRQRQRAERARPSCAAAATRRTCCWWRSTTRRSPATTTASASRSAAPGAKCSTATPRSTGAAARATWARIEASPLPHYRWPRSLTLTLPPLGAVILKPEAQKA